jgi:glycosyltransferase involved in cell wall biosynthesis
LNSNLTNNFIIGIDASRNRSGGAVAHLIGVLNYLNPREFGITYLHLWSYKALLDQLPDRPWLIKHSPKALESSLLSQLIWQFFSLKKELKVHKCDILFTTDASSLASFSPMVVLSQDMLSYESGILEKFGFGMTRLRLHLIYYLQNMTFRKATGVIFLTYYASRVIQQHCGSLKKIRIVPHGVHNLFKEKMFSCRTFLKNSEIKCIYVSPISIYKNQWKVIEAIDYLREQGFKVNLDIIGYDDGTATAIVDKYLSNSAFSMDYIRILGPVDNEMLPDILLNADIFVFASTCENLPVTLLEAMAVGIPIASSDRGPMPEVLDNGGLYFNPDDHRSIASSIRQLIVDFELRKRLSNQSKLLASQYSWRRCSAETFSFICDNLK